MFRITLKTLVNRVELSEQTRFFTVVRFYKVRKESPIKICSTRIVLMNTLI